MTLSRYKSLSAGISMAAAALLLTSCGVTDTQDAAGSTDDGPFYEGEEIQLIVPFSAGGASDGFSRLVGDHLPGHLEDEPGIVVENIPGGAQKNGLNKFERTEHNGLNMAMGSGGLIISTQFNQEGIQFDLSDYEPVAAFGETMVIFGSTAAGINSLEDLKNREEPVYYGGLELSASEVPRVFALEEMGLTNFEALMGYDGGGSVTAAVMRGELGLTAVTASHYLENVKPLAEAGDVVPLMVQGVVKDGQVVRSPAFPDLPTMPEAYEILTGESPEGTGWDAYTALTSAQANLLRTYCTHGDAPQPATEALNKAAAELVEDEAFIEEAKAQLGSYSAVVGDELDSALAQITELSPDTVTWVEDYRKQAAEQLTDK